MAADPLLQPFRLKHLTLRNRILITAHEPAYSEDGMPKDRYRLYHEARAQGGVALTMTAGSAVVAPDSPAAFGNLHIYDDAIVPWLRRLSDGVHRHGAAIMIQITHLGRRTNWNTADWLPVVAPSPIREPAHRAMPKEIEDWDIARIVRAYAAAAQRAHDGGLDGIEIEAYGHLLDAFWSPATNRRRDAYGGRLDNRLRFTFEVLAAVREAVGPDFIVGVRMVAEERRDVPTDDGDPATTAVNAGLDRAEGLEIARRLAASGLVDFLNVIRGHVDSDEGLSHVIPGMGTPAAPHLALAGEIRAKVGLPVFHAARIADIATARHAIAEGYLDMVGMTRAHIAEPRIAALVARGEEHRIRPCVGAGYCIDRIYEGGEALCIHNAATGREATMPHVITRGDGPARRIVVVGAGPAGLEAARVVAARGHGVTLFEAADAPGGQIRLAAALPRRREMIGIVDWRMAELERFSVDMRFNVYAEAGDVLAEAPDIVIVATGGVPDTDFLSTGADLVTTGWDILSGAARPNGSVLLFDDNGAHPGLCAAEAIAASGARLEFVTPGRILAPDVGGTNYPAYFKALNERDVTFTLNRRLHAVRRRGNGLDAVLWDEYAKRTEIRHVDQVVVECGTRPVDELYFALKPGSRNRGEVDYAALVAGRAQDVVTNPQGTYHLYRIGDAVAGRNVHAAIFDALRLCKNF
ncbi:MAG: FAD-dependent oxidoreductase [Alphaproteobacteria bacterium]|nr:MAG: FAD-dependent oxidoreductase [Alphaproteobacteria bacterium]